MSIEPTPIPATSTPDPVLSSEFTAAYKKHLPDLLAVKDDELVAMNLDPRAAAFTVLGSLPEIRQHADTIRQLPKFPVAVFENLETYAQALYYAHAIYLGAFPTDDEARSKGEPATPAQTELPPPAVQAAQPSATSATPVASGLPGSSPFVS